jgi:hypothetical protein
VTPARVRCGERLGPIAAHAPPSTGLRGGQRRRPGPGQQSPGRGLGIGVRAECEAASDLADHAARSTRFACRHDLDRPLLPGRPPAAVPAASRKPCRRTRS